MSRENEHRVKFKELTLRLRVTFNNQVEIYRHDRPDLRHLTVNWGNTSGNINLHLTFNERGGDKDRINNVHIPESEVSKRFAAMKPALQKSVLDAIQGMRMIRPGWLERNGYVVLYLDDEAQQRMLSKIFPKQKRHGKSNVVVDWKAIEDLAYSQEMIEYIYPPAILRQLAKQGYSEPVFAQCINGRRKGDLIALRLYAKPNGRRFWGLLENRFFDQIRSLEHGFFESCFKELLPESAWNAIYNELRLDEIGLQC